MSAFKRREGRATAIDRDHYERVANALDIVRTRVKFSPRTLAELDARRAEIDLKLEEIRDRRLAMGKDR